VGSVEYCALDSFVDFGTMYIACLHRICFPTSSFFLTSFPLRIDPLHFHGRGRKKRPKLGFLSCFSSCYSIYMFLMHAYLCSVSLGLLYIFVVICSGF